jgi:hypothetical protein
MKLLINVAVAIGLMGCASDGLSNLPDTKHQYYAQLVVMSEDCLANKSVSPELAAKTLEGVFAVLSRVKFKKELLISHYNSERAMSNSGDRLPINCQAVKPQLYAVIEQGDAIMRDNKIAENRAKMGNYPLFVSSFNKKSRPFNNKSRKPN